MMRLDAISVGKPREVQWQSKTIYTSIFKEPVSGSRQVYRTNIEGDEQSDTKLHGGLTRPVSVYASEYYDFWKLRLKREQLPWGFFGENLNISGGMFENSIKVGDRFTVGSVELKAVQPRFPCYKLGVKMGDQKWIKEFLDSRKTGFYFGVVKEGTMTPGDEIKKVYNNEGSITMDDITNLYLIDKDNKPLLEKALKVEELTPSWKEYFENQLSNLK